MKEGCSLNCAFFRATLAAISVEIPLELIQVFVMLSLLKAQSAESSVC
jgi:hypothetical protein